MGTKNNPEPKYDCLAHAKPDEPYFVLLGRDPMAGFLVRLWADMREQSGEDPDKVANARKIADEMDAWAKSLGKVPARPVPPMLPVNRDVDELNMAVAPGYDVLSWSPGRAGEGVPSTEVHLVLPVADGVKLALRLKSTRALDELVAVLQQHRKDVWP